MGIKEEENRTPPPPWGWPPAQKKNAHGVGEIVYHKAAKQNMHTKGRHHEQKKVYHKTGRRATPHGQAARNPGDGLERVRQPLHKDLAAALREGPQHPIRHLAAGVQARSRLPDPQARQPLKSMSYSS